MKILHVSTAKTWRGGEQQIAYLQEELAKLGIEQIIACRKDGAMAAHCQDKGIDHYELSKRSSVDPGFASRLARIARQEKIDIIHPHDSHAHTFTVMAATLFGMKTPIVLHRRVDYAVKNSAFSRFKYNHSQVKKIICVSEEVKRVLDQSLENPNRSVVVHSGIDTQKFDNATKDYLRQELGLSDKLTLVGNVAAITQQKDYFTFVETAAQVLQERQDVHFVIMGDGDQREEIEHLVSDKGLKAHFSFTGFRKDINRLLPGLDILLFTSEKEGLGTTLMDAMAAHVAIVSTNAGGIPELIEHQTNGLLAEVRDSQSLARHVLQLLDDTDQRNHLIAAASRRLPNYSKSRMAEGVLEVYQSIVS